MNTEGSFSCVEPRLSTYGELDYTKFPSKYCSGNTWQLGENNLYQTTKHCKEKVDLGSYVGGKKVVLHTTMIKSSQHFTESATDCILIGKHCISLKKAASVVSEDGKFKAVVFTFKNGTIYCGTCSRSSELIIQCGTEYAITSGSVISLKSALDCQAYY